jgi:TolA-binding protein
MAARVDAELASLVKARRTRLRASYGLVAAAAAVTLALGARQLHFGPRSLAISAEPGSGAKPTAPKVTPAAPPTQPALTPVASTSASRQPSGVTVAPSASAAASAEPASTLAEENQLFKEAAEAGRNGDLQGAVSRLDKLLRDHPASPLAQTAQVRKFRLLEKAGKRDEARREAERYLQAYPTGFAVKEAQALTAGGGEQGTP